MSANVDHLLRLLPERRWFGAKLRDLERTVVVDEAVLDDGPPEVSAAIVSVHFRDGGRQLYFLLLVTREDGSQIDAIDDVERLRLLGELMAHGISVKGSAGSFHFGGPGLDPLSPPGRSSIRGAGVEQTNSSVILDEQVIVKLFRRLEPGPNPDLELNRLLTNEGFENIPAQVGEITYEGDFEDGHHDFDLAIAQAFVADGAEGWRRTLEQLHRLYDSVEDEPITDALRDVVEDRAREGLDALEQLGHVSASLHVLLAREELEPDVSPEPVDAHDLRVWADRCGAALTRLRTDGAPELEGLAGAIEERVDALRSLHDAGLKTRVHGDYHLGQVLASSRGWMILDFEGEPLRSFDERRAKQSPLRDVAGMLRSFSYASTAALFERAEPDTDAWARLEPWSAAWEAVARDRFLTGYLRTSHEGRFLPDQRDTVAVMLDVFEMDKALYELAYERGHRPEWVKIPLRGIAQVIERGTRR